MADKPLQVINGRITEVEGTVVSAGVGNAGDVPALDSTGRLDSSVLPVGIGADTALVESSENLTAGDFVNIFDDGSSPSVPKVRKADASTFGKRAMGFVLANVTAPANATVYKEGSNTQMTGLAFGSEYYLSNTTPGGVTATPVTTTGHILQKLGEAFSSTVLDTEIARPIIRA